MRTKPWTPLNIILSAVLLTSIFLVGFTASSSQQEYDPWIDSNEDGSIDIFDAIMLANVFGTSGDATKNVTVTNWPISSETTVWYGNDSFPLTSPFYNRSGMSYLHILMDVLWAGPGSSIEFEVRGIIWDYLHVGFRYVAAYSVTLTDESQDLAVTMPVPSENFYFYIRQLSGDANICLSFYMTWT